MIDLDTAEPFFPASWRRECAFCGLGYNRSERVLGPLTDYVRSRYRLPKSPWSASERAEDC